MMPRRTILAAGDPWLTAAVATPQVLCREPLAARRALRRPSAPAGRCWRGTRRRPRLVGTGGRAPLHSPPIGPWRSR